VLVLTLQTVPDESNAQETLVPAATLTTFEIGVGSGKDAVVEIVDGRVRLGRTEASRPEPS